jgi:hypothetical protein
MTLATMGVEQRIVALAHTVVETDHATLKRGVLRFGHWACRWPSKNCLGLGANTRLITVAVHLQLVCASGSLTDATSKLHHLNQVNGDGFVLSIYPPAAGCSSPWKKFWPASGSTPAMNSPLPHYVVLARAAATPSLRPSAGAWRASARGRGFFNFSSGGGAPARLGHARFKYTQLPWLSPNTWISMWRGRCAVLLDQLRVVAEADDGLALARRQRRHRSPRMCPPCPCRHRPRWP